MFFFGAEWVTKPLRGSDTHHILLQLEVWRIYTLQTRAPFILNNRMDIDVLKKNDMIIWIIYDAIKKSIYLFVMKAWVDSVSSISWFVIDL